MHPADLKISESREFTAHGRTFRLKRLRRDLWFLARDAERRARFGNRAEITEDIAYVNECGALPPRSGQSWA